jgi:Na+-driven multidrug efflux pump
MLHAMVIALVAQWMVQFPLANILSKHTVLQASGLWWSFPVTNIIVAIVFGLLVRPGELEEDAPDR